MEHCVPLAAAARRTIILHAIDEHDNGWAEEDIAPRVNPQTGAIFDFVGAPADVRHAVWPRGVERLADDPWAAALVAQHALVIYNRFRDDSAWATFFATMQSLRDAMIRTCGWPLDDLLSDYRFVRLADLTSLAFCTGWEGEQHFGEWTVSLSGTRVITPDVFGSVEIPIAITARDIPNQPYSSDSALRDAIGRAHTATLHGSVIGGDRAG